MNYNLNFFLKNVKSTNFQKEKTYKKKQHQVHKMNLFSGNHSFGEIFVIGLTIMFTNRIITPFFAANEFLSLAQYFLQAWIVLKVDDAMTNSV